MGKLSPKLTIVVSFRGGLHPNPPTPRPKVFTQIFTNDCSFNSSLFRHLNLYAVFYCPTMDVPDNGTISSTSVEYLAVIEVRCERGFLFPDGRHSISVQCLDPGNDINVNDSLAWSTTPPDWLFRNYCVDTLPDCVAFWAARRHFRQHHLTVSVSEILTNVYLNENSTFCWSMPYFSSIMCNNNT